VVKTVPLEQWKVARELRRRIKARFDREGVKVPYPQQVVRWHRDGGPEPAPAAVVAQERPEPPPDSGEAKVARDLDERSDSGL
jgi:small conductance mechanosensitive channel